MGESERGRVQSLPLEAHELLLQRLRQSAQLRFESLAIDRIADERRADRGEMHAHLMRSPGLEVTCEQRRNGLWATPSGSRAEAGHDLVMRHRFATLGH